MTRKTDTPPSRNESDRSQLDVRERQSMYQRAVKPMKNETGNSVEMRDYLIGYAEGRVVPELAVLLTVRNEAGHEIGTHPQPFLRDPRRTYAFNVGIAPPAFARHDRTNRHYAHPGDVEFKDVRNHTGQKRS